MKVLSEIYSIQDLQRHYETHKRGHWFKPDTMRFFKCRLSSDLIYLRDRILFFSSEQGPNGIRRYTIRFYNPQTFEIGEEGLGFQGYKTLAAAKLAARKIEAAHAKN